MTSRHGTALHTTILLFALTCVISCGSKSATDVPEARLAEASATGSASAPAPSNADAPPSESAEPGEGNWMQWRGPLGNGVAPGANPPVAWSETENVRWKVPLPGKGHSTPIVFEDRIFLTSALEVGDELEARFSGRPGSHDNLPVTHRARFVVICLQRSDGRMLWETTVHEELPVEGGHVSGSLASASAMTDGEHVFAHFGSFGLFCLDLDGTVVWKIDLGQMHTKHGHGEGSSPALHGDTIVVNWDHEEQSFVVALDKKTGKERWLMPRNEVTSWSTPIIVEHGGRAQAIVPGSERMRGYDLETGEVIWECGGLANNICASPVFHRKSVV